VSMLVLNHIRHAANYVNAQVFLNLKLKTADCNALLASTVDRLAKICKKI
jgi:hypothetical protein